MNRLLERTTLVKAGSRHSGIIELFGKYREINARRPSTYILPEDRNLKIFKRK